MKPKCWMKRHDWESVRSIHEEIKRIEREIYIKENQTVKNRTCEPIRLDVDHYYRAAIVRWYVEAFTDIDASVDRMDVLTYVSSELYYRPENKTNHVCLRCGLKEDNITPFTEAEFKLFQNYIDERKRERDINRKANERAAARKDRARELWDKGVTT